MLVRELHDEVWWPLRKERLREVTLESYACAWRKWIEPTMGDWELASVTPRMLDAWIEEHDIRHGVWRVTKALIRTAYRYEVIDRDPCSRVLNPPSKGKPEARTLTRKEMVALMDGLKGTPVYATVVCSCTLGLRREEACALTWEDFDWKRGTVRVERGVQFINGREIEVAPKTILSLRTLPLPPETVSRLYALRGKGRLTGTFHVHQVASRYRVLCQQRGLPYVPLSNLRNS